MTDKFSVFWVGDKACQLPLYNEVRPGRDAYVLHSVMMEALPHAVRYWRVNGRVCSLQLRGGGVVKQLDAFPEYAGDEETFLSFMEQCYSSGIVRPSSYADLFSQRFRSPAVRWTYNALFASWFAGGWQEARRRGLLKQPHYKYDINSAYLWALSQGLPDVHSFRFTRHIVRSDVGGTQRGLYLVTLPAPDHNLPYPFNLPRKHVLATSEEIENYGLSPTDVHSGVLYDNSVDVSRMMDLIQSAPAAKLVSRVFWGRWVSRAHVYCHATRTAKAWPLRNPILNTVWAHLIVSRVKMRIWSQVFDPAHVYVDSVVTTREIPTGVGLGDWRLEARYLDGVDIRGPGRVLDRSTVRR